MWRSGLTKGALRKPEARSEHTGDLFVPSPVKYADRTGGSAIITLLSCVFPAYNEAENIGPLLDEATSALPGTAERYEIVVVDDGSTDGTADIVRRYAIDHPEVRL